MRRGKVPGVDLVHDRHLRDLHQVDRGLHDVVEGVPGTAQDGGDVLEHLDELLARPAGDEPPRALVEADLPSDEDEVARQHRLRVGTARLRRFLGLDGAPQSRTRCTFMTPRTRPRLRITRFSSSMLPTISSKMFWAL